MEADTKLFEEITSRDPHRIWAGSSAIVHLRDQEMLDMLSSRLPEIRAKTAGIELGGAWFPNRERLDFALRKLEYWKNKSGCLCRLYPGYILYNPNQEEKDGNIRLLETRYQESGWIDRYVAECTLCDTRFEVEEGESHYTWWKWEIVLDR